MTQLTGQSIGRYHILEQLGEGGMATVYKALDTHLEREVAVKVIRAEIFGRSILAQMLKRFEREAKALARLTHPNIVTIIDYGEHEGAPYLVMPYLPGGTLKSVLKGPVAYRHAIQTLLPIAQAVAHAHQLGIIHRDIKTSNILLTRTGEALLSDFGIAKILDAEETRDLTGTGVGIGTPEYMAPEQGMGQADERVDIYALGIVLYEMVTGRIPYRADTPMAVLLKKSQEPLPRPSQFVPGLPAALEYLLVKALAREPAQRYQDTREFIAALERLLQDAPTRPETPQPGKPNLVWILAGAGLLAGLALCAFGLFALLNRPGPGPLSAPPTATPPSSATPSLTPVPDASATLSPTATATFGPAAGEIRINPKDQAEAVYIPAATFEMGLSNAQTETIRAICNKCDTELDFSRPKHNVTLDAYYIYKYEVSNALYQRCVRAGNCSEPAKKTSANINNYYGNPTYDNYPVVFVTWAMAETYCQWAGGHLPTEAQWEYAARGPNGNLYPWGNQLPSSQLANLDNYVGDTRPVDSYPAGVSYFGLYNMSGNVWEWVFDWYQADYYQTNTNWVNPSGPDSGDIKSGERLKSGRGGAYWISLGGSSPGFRDWYQAAWTGSAVGFRCSLPVFP